MFLIGQQVKKNKGKQLLLLLLLSKEFFKDYSAAAFGWEINDRHFVYSTQRWTFRLQFKTNELIDAFGKYWSVAGDEWQMGITMKVKPDLIKFIIIWRVS